MPQNDRSHVQDKLTTWLCITLLVAAFLCGGSSRGDVLALLLLRPLALTLGTFALFRLQRSVYREQKFAFTLLLCAIGYIAVQLIPLPPYVWHALPGRAIVAEVDRVAGLGQPFRPLSLAPDLTRNALWSFIVPSAILLYAAQMGREARASLLPVLAALALFSGVLGLLQITQPNGPFYLYDISSFGSATGLFANRNHAAVFLASLFPMLAVLATSRSNDPRMGRQKVVFAICAGVFVFPLLVVTGSRAGVIAAAIGIASVPFLYDWPKKRSQRPPLFYLSAAFAIAILVLLLLYFSQATALQRLFGTSGETELRPDIWRNTIQAAWTYWPIGSGIGSFVPVFKMIEPTAILTISYVNHAHNDYLELFLTGGLLGVLLVAIAVGGCIWRAVGVWRGRRTRANQHARMSSVILLQLAVASIGDYPLRTPALAALAMILIVWLFADDVTQPTQVAKARA